MLGWFSERTSGTEYACANMAVISVVGVLDIASKAAASAYVELGTRIEVLPFLNIVHFRNTGAAFGMLADQGLAGRWTLVAASLLLSVALAVMIALRKGTPAELFAYALVLGGAIGNFYERIYKGFVVDFIDVHVGRWHWPAFNVADSAICVGVAVAMLAMFLSRGR